jgi:hypothetical protein
MSVYIANFGSGNWAWQSCLQRHSIAVMDDARVHPFWQRGDRDGYIAQALRVLRRNDGTTVKKAVASRWFNLNTILMETVGDLWIHRAEDHLWWTTSLDHVPQSEVISDPRNSDNQVEIFVYHKGCNEWSNKNKKGSS